jgi:hypothetical protein
MMAMTVFMAGAGCQHMRVPCHPEMPCAAQGDAGAAQPHSHDFRNQSGLAQKARPMPTQVVDPGPG